MTTSAELLCPKCCDNEPLARHEISAPGVASKVTIAFCPRCRGAWIDAGALESLHELRQYIPHAGGNIMWKRDLTRGVCAACGDRPVLERLSVGAFGVDRCPQCQGLWFDGGELGPTLTDQGYEALLRALRQPAKSTT
ncbi:MAG: zf-TFIIB domain-containing protein [Deltaproteobacteria bacterium]|nr:zf-TFIIB domain-containing protein [Deltaproteobacteria bacterium]